MGSRTKGESVPLPVPMSGPAQGALSRESDRERALSSWVQAVKAKVEASYPGQSNVAKDYYRL